MSHLKRVMITGNTGFIGSYLCNRLEAEGWSVSGIDLHPHRSSLPPDRQFRGDIVERDAVMQALENVDVIIHLAAEHKDFGVTEEQYFRVNQRGTDNLLRCATERGIRKFLFFSSVSVYGDQQGTTEETPPDPVTPYGKSKLAAEEVVRSWQREDSSRLAVIIRPTVVFGPMNRANIFRLIKQVCDGKFIWVGEGNQVKSVAYVENLVEATLFLLNGEQQGFHCFNYSDEPHRTTRELVTMIAEKAGIRIPRFRIPLGLALLGSRAFDVLAWMLGKDLVLTSARIRKFNSPTYHKAETILKKGFVPPVSVEEGIEKNVRWYLGLKESRDEFHVSE